MSRILAMAALLGCAIGLVSPPGAGSATAALREDREGDAPADRNPALMRKTPYLIYTGVETEMRVLWQLTSTTTCRLEWGTGGSYGLGSVQTTEYNGFHQHGHTITGLTPGQTYDYRVTVWNEVHRASFRAPSSGGSGDLLFVVYGDSRWSPPTHDQLAATILELYDVVPDCQTLVFNTGDLVNHGDDDADWTEQLFGPGLPSVRSLMARTPFQACMGNHDLPGVLFQRYLPYPHVAGRYWSFDYGPAHFTMVDQFASYGPGSSQLEWISDDLAATDRPWKFAVLHEPGWSAGGGHPNNTTVQAYLQPLFESHGVRVVFAGHNHYYCRALVDGVFHITTGGGGAPPYTPDPGHPHVVATATGTHYVMVHVSGDTLALYAVDLDGSVLDEFVLELDPAITVPPDVSVATGPRLGPARPSPFRTETTIGFDMTGEVPGRLVIRDVMGRTVRTYAVTGGGRQEITWNGVDDRGKPARAGVYLYELQTDAGRRARKMILLR